MKGQYGRKDIIDKLPTSLGLSLKAIFFFSKLSPLLIRLTPMACHTGQNMPESLMAIEI